MLRKMQLPFLNGVCLYYYWAIYLEFLIYHRGIWANDLPATAFIFTGYILSFAVDLMEDEDDYHHSSHKYHQLEMNAVF